MSSEKVTLAQAAGQVGVHINTIKTWRRAGYLKSAELIIEHGVEVWHVDLDEAIQFAQSKRKNRVDSSIDTGGYPAGYPEPEPAKQESTPAAALSTTPAQDQTIAFMRESVVRPLVEAYERQATELQKVNRENGELSAELRLVKQRLEALEAAQAARDASRLRIPSGLETPLKPPRSRSLSRSRTGIRCNLLLLKPKRDSGLDCSEVENLSQLSQASQ